jgi:hypothetical protein
MLTASARDFRPGCVAGPLVVPEVRGHPAGSEYEVVPGDFFPAGRQPSLCQVDRFDLREMGLNVPVGREDRSNRGCDMRSRKAGHGDLVEERLEEMVVLAVEEEDPA